ncbi:DUF962 domain-containing protein [Paenibacillus aurantius]|uniref:DUF962 domain-containing protein n=1 Tax=Paenibacillus aurantius TaxID=2918900 RepID=A0AA96LDH6_9BACL|nr:DUF962 domain-containing protein [Paenibacillus aurantius]WNQ10096.1 DUF962 domain-containing protein [Paenibacillus aurantius]
MKERFRRDLLRYMSAHRHPVNRALHYAAFLLAFLAWGTVWVDLTWTVVLALAHYVLSWIGHYGFERNRPASFRSPWIGFYAGFSWFFLRTIELATGRRLLDRLTAGSPPKAEPGPPAD